MAIAFQQVFDFISDSPFFSQLDEDERKRLVKDFDLISVKTGQVLFTQQESACAFYLLLEGNITLTRQKNRRIVSEVDLQKGDPVGEESLLRGDYYRTTAMAGGESVLLRIRGDRLRDLIDQYPRLADSRSVLAGTQKLIRLTNLDWLGRDERVVMLNRKHTFFLFIRMLIPALLVFIGLILLLLNLQEGTFTFSRTVVVGLSVGIAAALLWIFWVVLDWANDYFILTSRRMVRVDRTAGVFDQREEIPLTNIMAVEMGTTVLGKMFDFGDITSRTYNTPVVWHGIPSPDLAARLIELMVKRTKTSNDELEMSAMQSALDRQLNGVDLQTSEADRSNGNGAETVTFRKHWIILLHKTWLPFTFGAACIYILLGGLSSRLSAPLSDPLKWVTGMSVMVFVIWYLYQLIDWGNDIYQITSDQVLDVKRTPLGREDRKSAMLESILSINYRRRGLLGVLLNYGVVNIQVGAESLIFDYVRDPSGVQREIYRHIAERQAALRQVNIESERDRMAQWIAAYHRRINE
ncbi:MAG: cyclic nucleotide-binding domain-containing protein [Anaerolineaceae bacterium]|nr:cyclic nucleotide-binding domain-containing protein [Anaerolineaceae bacterium]